MVILKGAGDGCQRTQCCGFGTTRSADFDSLSSSILHTAHVNTDVTWRN